MKNKNIENKNKNKKFKRILVFVCIYIVLFLLMFFILLSAFSPMMVSAVENTETLTETEKITDLTGTIWEFNSYLDLPSQTNLYYVSFSDGHDVCGGLKIGPDGLWQISDDFLTYYQVYKDGATFDTSYSIVEFLGGVDVTNFSLIDFLYANAQLVSQPEQEPEQKPEQKPDEENNLIIDGWNGIDAITYINFGVNLDVQSVFDLTDTQAIYHSLNWAESGVKPYVFIRYLPNVNGDIVRCHFSYDSYADALYYGISPNVRLALGSYSYIAEEVIDFSTMPFYGEHDNLTVYQESDYPFSCLNGEFFSGYTIVWDDVVYGGYAIMYKYANPVGPLASSDVVYTERDGWINDVYRYILGDESFLNYYTVIYEGEELLLNSYAYEFMTLNYKSDYIPYDIYYHLVYSSGYEKGYPDGYKHGFEVASVHDIGENLLGDTLLAPVRALDSIVLYTSSNGFQVTLWGVFGTVVGVSLFVWFMKMFLKG